MFSHRTSLAMGRVLLLTVVLILTRPVAGMDGGFRTLYGFGEAGGNLPVAGVVADSAGNLYGTTRDTGDGCCGTVFELVQNTGGRWQEKVLYEFQSGGDGDTPEGTLIFDKAGSLYGTTAGPYGTVFKLILNKKGSCATMPRICSARVGDVRACAPFCRIASTRDGSGNEPPGQEVGRSPGSNDVSARRLPPNSIPDSDPFACESRLGNCDTPAASSSSRHHRKKAVSRRWEKFRQG
jgi:hypothetical protein